MNILVIAPHPDDEILGVHSQVSDTRKKKGGLICVWQFRK